jgi:hypothetical protein
LAGAWCLLWGAVTLQRIVPAPGRSFDFVQEWASTRNFFTGRPIYDSLRETIPLYMGGDWQALLLDVNAHPPASVLVLLPGGMLPYRAAHGAFNVLSLIALGVALWLLMRRSGLDYPAWSLLPIGALILSSNSFIQQMFQGQLNLLLLGLIAGGWAARRANRPVLGGVLLGLAAGIKLFPAFLGLFYLCRREWRALAAMIATFLALNGLTAAVFGLETYRDYFGLVVPAVGNEFRDYWANASITGFWSKLCEARSGHVVPLVFSPPAAKIGILAGVLAVIGLTAWKVWSAARSREQDVAFAVCLIAMMLVSPITWDHYFLMLIVAWMILWKYLPDRPGPRAFLLATIVVLGTLRPPWIWLPVIGGPGESGVTGLADDQGSVALPIHTLTVLSYQFYGLVILLAFALGFRPAEQTSGEVQPA